jgi:hypothetical protein
MGADLWEPTLSAIPRQRARLRQAPIAAEAASHPDMASLVRFGFLPNQKGRAERRGLFVWPEGLLPSTCIRR